MRLPNDVRGGVRFEVTFEDIDRQIFESPRVQLNNGFVSDETTYISEKIIWIDNDR